MGRGTARTIARTKNRNVAADIADEADSRQAQTRQRGRLKSPSLLLTQVLLGIAAGRHGERVYSDCRWSRWCSGNFGVAGGFVDDRIKKHQTPWGLTCHHCGQHAVTKHATRGKSCFCLTKTSPKSLVCFWGGRAVRPKLRMLLSP